MRSSTVDRASCRRRGRLPLPPAALRPADVPTVPPRAGGRPTPQEILGGIKAPAGFEVKVFAAPPIVNYPACVTATLAGELFVCVDRNSSLQADPGMGSILRLVDRNNDGQADEYTVFATMDSPRGAVFDGETLYVSHPPFSPRYRDTDGDGIADESRTLVRGLGFGLDFRGADHTTNGIEMGVDGWLYVAVGDYGVVKAVGADGKEIQMRGGGNVRVRPDGTDLEIYARGTRNDYDLAIDPYHEPVRARQHQRRRRLGHPAESLRRRAASTAIRRSSGTSPTRSIPPLADYGGGSGTGMLYVQDPGLPAPFGDALYSVDWGTNFDLSASAAAEGRDVHGRPGSVPRPAAADRHGGRRRLAPLRRELAGRTVPLRRRADRLPRAPDAPGRARRRRCPTSRPPPTRGWSSSSRRPIRCTAGSRSRRCCGAGRSPERIALLEKRVLGVGPAARAAWRRSSR